MCDDCHLTALAAFAVKHALTGPTDVDLTKAKSIDRVRIMLGRENVASLRYRYPRDTHADYVGKTCAYAVANTADPVAIAKAAECYAYQACEHPGWRKSKAYALIQRVVETACSFAGRPLAQAGDLPGYNEAAWGFDCAHDLKPIVDDRDDYHARWLAECRAHGETRRKLEAILAAVRAASDDNDADDTPECRCGQCSPGAYTCISTD
jgi:hypothetical protein